MHAGTHLGWWYRRCSRRLAIVTSAAVVNLYRQQWHKGTWMGRGGLSALCTRTEELHLHT